MENQSPQELFDRMKTWRDEFKLKAHLLRAEIKDEWEELEDKWKELNHSLKQMDASAGGIKEEVKSNAKKLAAQLHDRYSKIKKSFTEGAR